MKKFLIINPFGIGDVLFTTPIISNIKDAYPDSLIGYWCNERVKGILEPNPKIDRIFALSRGDLKKIFQKNFFVGISKALKLFSQIRKERFDVSIDCSLDHRYGLVSKLAGIRQRLGYNYKNRGRFLTKKIDLSGYSAKHVVEYYLDLLRFIGINPKRVNLELALSSKDKIKADKLLNDYGVGLKDLIVVIAPGAGASWGVDASFKHWPQKNFAQLADLVMEKYSVKVLILGDEPESTISQNITSLMRNKPVDLTGKTDLGVLAAIIDRSDFLIANDGGPLHMGVALNKKTLSFYGPVSPLIYGPYPPNDNRHIVLKSKLNCVPCYHNFRLSECKNNKECLEDISVNEAFEAAARLLTGERNN
ncbi:MAG: glycosyltransferase family 9 protein [Candidatus Omnitrophica bacterium]|nr:glycosyltransferase family 9 protein [Candidatus Omnitrophota bacterium]